MPPCHFHPLKTGSMSVTQSGGGPVQAHSEEWAELGHLPELDAAQATLS